MIDPGKYRARATDAQLGNASNGTDTVAVAFELLDHPGTHITWYGYFTEKTMARTMESLRYCGWDKDDLSDLSGIDSNEVELVIVHEDGQDGKTRARVNWVNRPGSSKAQIKNVMSDAQKAAFAARMKGAAIASRAKIPPKDPAHSTTAASERKRREPPAGAGDAYESPEPDPEWMVD